MLGLVMIFLGMICIFLWTWLRDAATGPNLGFGGEILRVMFLLVGLGFIFSAMIDYFRPSPSSEIEDIKDKEYELMRSKRNNRAKNRVQQELSRQRRNLMRNR